MENADGKRPAISAENGQTGSPIETPEKHIRASFWPETAALFPGRMPIRSRNHHLLSNPTTREAPMSETPDDLMEYTRRRLAEMEAYMEASRDAVAASQVEPVSVAECVTINAEDGMPLNAFIAAIADALEKVPGEHREDAELALRGGDDDPIYVQIRYSRPETTKEAKDRKMRAARHNARVRESDLAKMRALKEKYGDPA